MPAGENAHEDEPVQFRAAEQDAVELLEDFMGQLGGGL
jgi:hypothetical protein